jgi:hypothetical protein
MKDDDKAVSITPARLELITDVGPPDCPTNALPLTMIFFFYIIPFYLFVSLPH